ncbi:unnamed protein product, partial [Mesorhabditis belari]|uniref:Uncharacterized protein n=1 Tax=Mesorhabditis belari TaxID=2138241 RepID=A0AAF3EPR0_9BILA
MTLIDSLPQDVKSLIPKENADFCHSLSAEEAEHLKDLLGKHKTFCNIDGLMEDCQGVCASLHGKFQSLLGANSARLSGLSDEAKGFAKEVRKKK